MIFKTCYILSCRGVCECQKMEEACERAVADQAALHTQLQLVQKTLIDYKTRLASKVFTCTQYSIYCLPLMHYRNIFYLRTET